MYYYVHMKQQNIRHDKNESFDLMCRFFNGEMVSTYRD